ncbi:aldo/keto reductase family oxidoreductase [Streptomyces sp. 3MP-14]|uniref:Aldo/keto reductase family oxidoreductase n=1 Tax=Streptomyces mimosae TaxID=2586635 RepID=A0A5N6AQ65_9ACTN|nr:MULTISPECIES: aldo/keto reductase [Streptomyces]KAB8169768.1 aldo/keto reductase family oxidoreductase [Streptomyces mimosae]KAB8178516.1 aldo/keto reductase family oxidoreductase [Streptomyces sp. 3MP-14]
MKSIHLGGGTPVPNVALGLMRIGEKSDDEIRTLVRAARDAGVDFFDHADIYGGAPHHCEARFADALRLSPSERAEVTIQTKAGIVPSGPHYDFSYEHLVSSVEGSLRALRTDYLDVLLLHRPDALVEPEEVARAFDHLESSGKVRAFGVSNHTPRQIDLLRTAVRQPLVANQLRLSLVHAPIVAQGVAANMAGHEQATVVDGGGVLDYCRLNGITVQTWGSFQGHGRVFLGSPEHPELNAVIDRLADRYAVTPTAIATAWITRHPANMQVVLGTTTPTRVADAVAGSNLPLERAEWYELFRAAGHHIP